jgi:hypothetical protein
VVAQRRQRGSGATAALLCDALKVAQRVEATEQIVEHGHHGLGRALPGQSGEANDI